MNSEEKQRHYVTASERANALGYVPIVLLPNIARELIFKVIEQVPVGFGNWDDTMPEVLTAYAHIVEGFPLEESSPEIDPIHREWIENLMRNPNTQTTWSTTVDS